MNRNHLLRGVVILGGLVAVGALCLGAREPEIARPHRPVARIWRGRTLSSRADEYEKYLDVHGIEKIRATPGNIGVTVLRRPDGADTEFVVISMWESLDAVKNYAGVDYQKAVLLPRDREYLVSVAPNVFHYEVVRDERGR